MDAGLDTGPIIEVAEVPIADRETALTLHDKLAATGAAAVVAVLQRLARDRVLPSSPQPAIGATYAAKLERAEATIDWSQPSDAIDRAIRAFDPVPGAHTAIAGTALKVWRAQPLPCAGRDGAGVVLAAGKDGIDVACGTGALRLIEVQPAAGRRMPAAAFALGHAIGAGSRFAAAPR